MKYKIKCCVKEMKEINKKMKRSGKNRWNRWNIKEETQKSNFRNVYPVLFKGLGQIEPEHHIELNDSALSIVYPPRKIHDLHEKLKELESVEITGVIRKVDEPTECFNSMVVVEKPNGKLRVQGP